MGLFDRFLKKKSLPADALIHETPTMFYVVNEFLRSLVNADGRIKTDTVEGQSAAFSRASIIDAILFEKVSSIKDARYWFYSSKGEEVERPAEMERVMAPNSYEGLAQFVAKVEFFSQLYGKAYIAKVQPVGVSKEVSLHVLPNVLVRENKVVTASAATFTPRDSVKSYSVKLDTKWEIELAPEDVVEVYDVSNNPYTFGNTQSRLVPLEDPINTFIAGYNATNELLVNRGMLGIIAAKGQGASGMLYTKDEQEELLKSIEQRYGVLGGRSKFAISSRDLAYIPISSTIKDLGLGEIREGCKKDICYTYQIPSVLLDVEGSTYSNYGEAKRKLYSSDIIPTANYIAGVLTQIFGFKGFSLKATFDHLDIFQDAKRLQAAGLASLVSAINQATQSGIMDAERARQILDNYLTE